MNDIRDRARSLWLKGMNAIGNTAAGIANNTRNKVDEMTIQNRRREIVQDVAARVYALWQKGETFPPEIAEKLEELQNLDEKLNDLRASQYAQGGEADGAPSEDNEAEPDPEFMTDMEAHMQSKEESFFSEAPEAVKEEINARFDTNQVEQKAEAVNSSLEELSDRMRRFDREEESRE